MRNAECGMMNKRHRLCLFVHRSALKTPSLTVGLPPLLIMNYWQGNLVRLRGVEPSDAEAFFRWNLDSETGRALDFLWPPVSLARVRKQIEEAALEKFGGERFTWV